MGYPPIEDLLPKAGGSIYKLVRMAARRAIELADGHPKLIQVSDNEKTPTVALEEIRAGKVVLIDVAEQFRPKDYPKPKKESKASQEPEMSAKEG